LIRQSSVHHNTRAQLKASVDQASATAAKAKAQLQLAQENYDRQSQLFEKSVFLTGFMSVLRCVKDTNFGP
jgi:multidrug resistance efflux pump